MPISWYCYSCKVPLNATQKRCVTCGDEAAIAPGSVLSSPTGIYTILDLLGVGGMGAAYKAQDSAGNLMVAKFMFNDPDAAIQAENLMRFKREANILCVLNSPRFPRGYPYFQDSGMNFMGMAFVSGRDLEKELKARTRLPETETLMIGIQLCEGMEVMHTHIDATGSPDPLLHRDIKPGNIMLQPNGDIVILDLGIARPEKQSAGTVARVTSVGTMEYVAYEQFNGKPVKQSDLYSIAATLFHLVMGNCFHGDWDARLTEVDALPFGWRPVFRKAIAKDYHLRHRSANELKQDLISLLPAVQRPAPPPAQPAAVPPPAQAIPLAPPPAQQVSIRWRSSASTMINPGEYRQVIAGQIIRGIAGVPGANVIPLVTDFGGAGSGTGASGTTVQASHLGDFSLAVPDITVPVAVSQRQIQIVVEDPATGQEIHRETVTIARPWNATMAQAQGAFASIVRSPFKAFAQWRQQQQLNQAPLIQAKASAQAAKIAAKAQNFQAKQAAKAAKAQAKASAQAAKIAAQAAQPVTQSSGSSGFGLLLAIVFALLAVWTAARGNENGLYMTGLSAYMSVIAFRFANQKRWQITWQQVVTPTISFAYLAVLLALFLTR